MTPTATTTAVIAMADNFINTNGPQVLLLLVGVLGVLFIWVIAKKGIKKIWGFLKRL